MDNRRITLVCRAKSAPERAWLDGPADPLHLIFVDSFGVVPYALSHGVEELGKDIEGVIMDGSASAAEFLQLLSVLPGGFAGDVVLIDDECAFVSATGRGGNRVLYALSPEDVDFYLQTKMLTSTAAVAA